MAAGDPETASEDLTKSPLTDDAASVHSARSYGNNGHHDRDGHHTDDETTQAPHEHDPPFFDPAGMAAIRRSLSRLSDSLTRAPTHPDPEHATTTPILEQKHSDDSMKKNRESGMDMGDFDDDMTLADVHVGDGPFDFEKLLRLVMRKLDKADGTLRPRELGVYFRDLSVTAPAPTSPAAADQPTVGSLFANLRPSVLKEVIGGLRHPRRKEVLQGFEGVVRPGEMLLVLGRPNAGCTTLLRTLASHPSLLASSSPLHTHGTLRYDSLPSPLPASSLGDTQYSPESDAHLPTLTVEQTLRFAARCRTPARAARPPGAGASSSSNKHKSKDSDKDGKASREVCEDLMVEVLLTVFGLRGVRGTRVGDEWVRGVSGGQRKRVSIAEVLAMRARVACWDNSTRGLDASTALEFVQALRIATDVARMTTVVSLYQAGEPLYALFDKVCVIYEGRMAYFGPAREARQYFIDMGYEPKNRQTTADFLVAVTDPNGRNLRPRANPSIPTPPPPHTAEEFAAYYRASPTYAANRADVDAYAAHPARTAEEYYASVRAEHARHTRKDSAYIISVPMQARALMMRRVQVLMGDKLTEVFNFMTFVIQAIIIGTVFFRLKNSSSTFYSRGGVLFFAILFSALVTMAEIPALFSKRAVVLRQAQAAMYHPFVESLALTLVDVPITFVTLVAFSLLLYFLVGLEQTAAQFFIFFLFVFSMTVTMKAWFRALAAAFGSPAPAQTVAGMSILVLTLYTGYTIPQPSMIGALRWITYINPLKYGFEGLLVNEMHTVHAQCAVMIPQGPGYDGHIGLANQVCTALGSEPGEALVSGTRYVQLAFGYSYDHLWRNWGIICAFGAAFIAAYLTFTQYNTRSAGDASVTLYKRGTRTRPVPLVLAPVHQDEETGQVASCAGTLEEKPPVALDEKRAVRNEEEKQSTAPGEKEKQPAVVNDEKKSVTAMPSSNTNTNTNTNSTNTNLGTSLGRKMTVAPVMTDVFSWQHLEYTVPLADGTQRRLLDDVSGFVAPGKLTALMGESGAGKTTLLNVLAERQEVGVVRGDRFVNGQPLPMDFQAQTGYCQQLDTHLPTSTVREALLFSAKMRQPPAVPLEEKEAYVEKCLEMCGLVAYADAIVGTLSVEHRKRTTIAVELVAKPRLLLFLDEPTSGLDSQSAWAIVAFLRELADKAGQAILCTIHQPSGELFQVFDRLLLLRVGGQTVYFGDIGYNSSTMLSYFERNGARPCHPDENPAEYILQVIGAGATATTDRDWHSVWMDSAEAQAVQKEIETIHTEGRKKPPVQTNLQTTYATSWGYQTWTLFQRDCQAHWRDPVFVMSKIALNIVSGLFIGFTFWKSKDTLQGTQDKLFSIFMATVISVALSQQLQVPFIGMRDLYEVRERPSRMYSWTALVTSQILAEVPWNVLGSSFFFVCWYWTVGYSSEASRAGYAYLLLGVSFPLYYTTVGQAIAAMSPSVQIAALNFSSLFSFVLIFNGVLQPFRSLGWWRWMYRVSPFSYLIEGLLGSVIGREAINCAPVEFVQVNPPSGATCSQYLQPFINVAGGYLANPNATTACGYCPYSTTDQFLAANFSIEYDHRWRDFGIFVAFIAFNVCATYAFTYIFRIQAGGPFAALVRRIEARKARSRK